MTGNLTLAMTETQPQLLILDMRKGHEDELSRALKAMQNAQRAGSQASLDLLGRNFTQNEVMLAHSFAARAYTKPLVVAELLAAINEIEKKQRSLQ